MLGSERLDAPEVSVSVPRDLDLTQSEADLMFDAADHPDLDSAGAATLADLKPPDLAVFSSRLFIVRAFSAGARVAALAVCAGASDAARRKPFSVNVAVMGSRSIIDQAWLGGEPTGAVDAEASVGQSDDPADFNLVESTRFSTFSPSQPGASPGCPLSMTSRVDAPRAAPRGLRRVC